MYFCVLLPSSQPTVSLVRWVKHLNPTETWEHVVLNQNQHCSINKCWFWLNICICSSVYLSMRDLFEMVNIVHSAFSYLHCALYGTEMIIELEKIRTCIWDAGLREVFESWSRVKVSYSRTRPLRVVSHLSTLLPVFN